MFIAPSQTIFLMAPVSVPPPSRAGEVESVTAGDDSLRSIRSKTDFVQGVPLRAMITANRELSIKNGLAIFDNPFTPRCFISTIPDIPQKTTLEMAKARNPERDFV